MLTKAMPGKYQFMVLLSAWCGLRFGEVAAVFRALATIEGTISRIYPGFDLVAASRQFASAHVIDRLAPESLRRTATEELVTLLPMLRRLPRRIDRIAAGAEDGRLGLNIRLFADERDRRYVTALLQQVLLTVLGASTGLMAVLLLGTPGGPQVRETVGLLHLFGYNLLVVCVVLVLRGPGARLPPGKQPHGIGSMTRPRSLL